MNVLPTEIAGVAILEPRVFADQRGFFLETYQLTRYRSIVGTEFVQDNHSRSSRAVLRGLHYQLQHPQGKLIWVTRGEIFDVAVDLRRKSPTFGKWTSVILSDENHRQVFVPPGLAHGFCVLSELADVTYKCTDYYFPDYERTILWNDPALSIHWPIHDPIVSAKDRRGVTLDEAECF